MLRRQNTSSIYKTNEMLVMQFEVDNNDTRENRFKAEYELVTHLDSLKEIEENNNNSSRSEKKEIVITSTQDRTKKVIERGESRSTSSDRNEF